MRYNTYFSFRLFSFKSHKSSCFLFRCNRLKICKLQKINKEIKKKTEINKIYNFRYLKNKPSYSSSFAIWPLDMHSCASTYCKKTVLWDLEINCGERNCIVIFVILGLWVLTIHSEKQTIEKIQWIRESILHICNGGNPKYNWRDKHRRLKKQGKRNKNCTNYDNFV